MLASLFGYGSGGGGEPSTSSAASSDAHFQSSTSASGLTVSSKQRRRIGQESKATAMSRDECYSLAMKMRAGGFEAKETGLFMREVLPQSLWSRLPGRTECFFVPRSPVYPHLAYLSLRGCTERLNERMGYVLGANLPGLRELDASRCCIEACFVEAILHVCKGIKTLTIKDSRLYGSQIKILSTSLELLTLASDTYQNESGLKTYLHCSNLKQCHINLSYYRVNSDGDLKEKLKGEASATTHFPKELGNKNERILGSTESGDDSPTTTTEGMSRTLESQIASNVGHPVKLSSALNLSTMCRELLTLKKLEYLSLTTVREDDISSQLCIEFADCIDNTYVSKLVSELPKLKTFSLEGSFRGVRGVEVEHGFLKDLSLVNLPALERIKIRCPSLQQFTYVKLKDSGKLCEVDLSMPNLKKINLFPFESEEEKLMVSRLARDSVGLVELNGVTLDENHPDAAGLIEGGWCSVA